MFPHTFQHTVDDEGNAEFSSNPRDLFTEANFRKFERSWDDNREATAFFRGTATGMFGKEVFRFSIKLQALVLLTLSFPFFTLVYRRRHDNP